MRKTWIQISFWSLAAVIILVSSFIFPTVSSDQQAVTSIFLEIKEAASSSSSFSLSSGATSSKALNKPIVNITWNIVEKGVCQPDPAPAGMEIDCLFELTGSGIFALPPQGLTTYIGSPKNLPSNPCRIMREKYLLCTRQPTKGLSSNNYLVCFKQFSSNNLPCNQNDPHAVVAISAWKEEKPQSGKQMTIRTGGAD